VVKLFSGLNSVSSAGIFLLITLVCCGESVGQSFPASQPADPLISEIRIQVSDFYGRETYWVDMVQCIVSTHIRKGDRFSKENVQRLVTALKACRRFRSIHLDTETNESGLTLIIDITPFRLIKDIQIHGKYPLFEKQIFNAMTLYPGGAFIQEEVDKQAGLVADLYRRFGYADPKVNIESIQEGEAGHYVMQVMIEKGRPRRLGTVDIQGNKAFSDAHLRWKMKSVRTDNQRFAEKIFLEDIEKLKKYYREKGFADVTVEHRITTNSVTQKVDVLITLEEGDRYDVEFEGNTEFWDLTLKKDIVLFSEGNRRGTAVRKSIRNIEKRYHEAGYPEVIADVETRVAQEENISVRNLRFVINEGPREIVRKVVVSGNTFFSEEKLKNQMLTRPPGILYDGQFVPQKLEEDILAIQNLYHDSGFLDVGVKRMVNISGDRKTVDVHVKIDEGMQTKVTHVELSGLTVVPAEKVLKRIQNQAGRPFSRNGLTNDEKRIAIMISEKGYPYVQVAGDATFSADRSQARVEYSIVQNNYIKRGRTFYSGNFRTRERILNRELIMKPGDPFSLKKMLQGQQNLRSMNIFRSVTFHPVGLKEEAETIHLFTELEEEKPFYFETSSGYTSDKGLFATSTLGDHNFLGLNKDAKISAEISEVGYKGESRIFEPRFFGTRVSSDLGIFFERSEPFNQTFGTDTRGTDLVFSRKWRRKVKGGLGFHYEFRENFTRDGDVAAYETFDQRGILVVTPSISYDSRDNFMNPKEGLFMLCWMDISRGMMNSLDDFYKYRIDLRGYTTPIDRLTFAVRGGFGKIEPYGSEGSVPQDQLFFLGGTGSIRGFDENLFLFDENNDPVGGQLMAMGNAESRIDLGANVELSLFYDIGYLDETSGQYRAENVRYTTGVGLRYVTPVGAFGLIYGHKLNPEPDESRWRVHFSIGYTF